MSLLYWSLVGVYTTINLLLSIWLYNGHLKYYEPAIIPDTEDSGKKSKDLHDHYPEWRKYDKKTSFIRIFLGSMFLVWPRLIICTFMIFVIWFNLK
jgi:hypothetical protein